MKRRSLPITLRYEERNPERRDPDAYAVGDLEAWLDDNRNVRQLMTAILTIISGWVAEGAPRRTVRMASFGPWASATAGLLDWAGIVGFPDSWGDTVSQEDGEWVEFFEMWAKVIQGEATAREVIMQMPSAMLPPGATTLRGETSPRKLGSLLAANEGRWIGQHRLVARTLKGRVFYRMETSSEE